MKSNELTPENPGNIKIGRKLKTEKRTSSERGAHGTP